MSRLDEVDQTIKNILYCAENFHVESNALQNYIRTIADEVDARDAVITKLLAMLKPGEEPKPEAYDGYDQLFRERLCRWNDSNKRYARALEIAGRTE